MLRFGCILPNLANICSHKSTDAKFYPITEGDKELLDRFREDVVGGPSILSTRKTFVDETSIRKSTNICEAIVGIDTSQLFPNSMCKPMPTGIYWRWDLDSETGRLMIRQNKTPDLKILLCSSLNEQDQNLKLKASLQQADRRKKSA